MRKRVVGSTEREGAAPAKWIDVERCARVELTSEDPGYLIENALRAGVGSGWRAATPGRQTIRLRFDQPTGIRRIHLAFREDGAARTQEFSLHWSDAGGATREILRQQYTFSPPGTTSQVEDYTVDLAGATDIELVIVPDIQGSEARASLSRWLLG